MSTQKSKKMRIQVRFPIALALGLALCAPGCLTNDNIKVHDHDTITPAVRVKWQATQQTRTSSAGLAFSGLVVETETSYTAANADQYVAAGNQVAIGNAGFPGPVEVKSRAKVTDVTVNARGGLAIHDILRLEPVLGVELTSLDLEIASGAAQSSSTSTSFGFVIGGRAGIQPHELIEFYGQCGIGYLFGGSGSTYAIRTWKTEVGARVMPLDHFGLFAAYRWADYFQFRDSDGSDADLKFRGPVLGMELSF